MKKTIIDVRTTAEYQGGHVEGSINIPLSQLVDHVDQIRAMPQPIVLCCASGGRSGQATGYLQSIGIDCTNGGSWMALLNNN